MKLDRRCVEKPWGLTTLPPVFDPPPGERIGEVWFTGGGDLPLLLKYLFTSERLSVQVHPDDAYARAHGLPHGKSECWYILDANPGATIALGLLRDASKDALRAAALDGSIEQLLDWKPVRKGDFFFVPPGTVHAIGEGITLLEFQQNIDLTYRLYDYGRPRELHLDDGIAVSNPTPYPDRFAQHLTGGETRTLVDGPHFKLVHSTHDRLLDRQRWVIPIDDEVSSGSDTAGVGECLLLEPGDQLETANARLLIGARA
jgi:mannose-6-phosphate isomerase